MDEKHAPITKAEWLMLPTVSCADNPYDLRPALDGLMSVIGQQPLSKPLVVVMGEAHNAPVHAALRQGLMSRLLQSGSSIAFGIEHPHNLKWQLIMPCMSETNKNLFRFIRAKNISMQFNDMAYRVFQITETKSVLKQQDPKTRKLVAQFSPDNIDKDIDTVSPLGMALRNQMMVENASRHIRETGAQVYIQHCGLLHVVGGEMSHEQYKYEDSLTARFEKAGFDALPVLIQGFEGALTFPAAAIPALHKGLSIAGMTKRTFNGDFDMFLTYPGRKFLRRISKNSGDDIEIMPRLSPAQFFSR